MTMHTDARIKQATRNLTGSRMKDIAYLQSQIDLYQDEPVIINALKRILSGLLPIDALFVAA